MIQLRVQYNNIDRQTLTRHFWGCDVCTHLPPLTISVEEDVKLYIINLR